MVMWFACRCRTLCEGPLRHQEPLEFSRAVTHYLTAVLECRGQCIGKLGEFPRDTDDDILTSYFRYLQFSYYQSEGARGGEGWGHPTKVGGRGEGWRHPTKVGGEGVVVVYTCITFLLSSHLSPITVIPPLPLPFSEGL